MDLRRRRELAAQADLAAGPVTPPVSPSLLMAEVIALPRPEPAPPLHRTMLEMLHEARRRGMSHQGDSLPACELMLEIHAPEGELMGMPCAACHGPWPCTTVLGILGGLE